MYKECGGVLSHLRTCRRQDWGGVCSEIKCWGIVVDEWEDLKRSRCTCEAV